MEAIAAPEFLEVTLPGGYIGEDGGCYRECVLRPLRGREEEWLAGRARSVPLATTVTYLLAACVIRIGPVTPITPHLAGELLVGDRDYLVQCLRRFTLGDRVQAVMTCAACAAKMDVDFSLADVSVKAQPHRQKLYMLSADDHQVEFHLPCGADQEAVAEFVSLAEATATMLDRCVVRIDGQTPTPGAWAEIGPAGRAAIETAMEAEAPNVDLELGLICPECRHAYETPFNVAAFFLSEMKVDRQQLQREVHTLAFYYHWSEAEIMSFSRDKRRAYVDLLARELSRGQSGARERIA